MPEDSKYNVFLSYSAEDKPWVGEFASALKSNGLRTWFDAHELRAGDRWQQAIETALRDSRVFVLVVTPHSFSRPWTYFELGAAVASDKRIIPVVSADVDPDTIPPLVRQFQYVRESSPIEAAKRVAEAIPEQVQG